MPALGIAMPPRPFAASSSLRYGSMYERIAAEPSEEEVESIMTLLERNCGWATYPQLLDALLAEHPLCLESDLIDLLNRFMAARRRVQAPPPPPPQLYQQQQQQQYTTANSVSSRVSPCSASQRQPNTEDPEIYLESKWTPTEIELLRDYLHETKGRKNWVACAQRVGTKSSAQCKAKFNNMRAQSNSRGHIDL
ncbi:hypothetical protein H4R21_006086 [Coemansia helicoidea]|uniref:Uncharacterized protein n=2 Tax=Coemansia TaxID=4863 RepID=A0ACC1KQ67_9FUNG|nr:hypothetical protein H4R21_006086 [Coemansia helicoidea]